MVYRISTGYVRPGIVKMGHPKKYAENLSASSVADVTMSFRSLRFSMMPWGFVWGGAWVEGFEQAVRCAEALAWQ